MSSAATATLAYPSADLERSQTSRLCLWPFDESYITDRYLSWLNDPEVTRYLMTSSADRESVLRWLERFDGKHARIFAVLHVAHNLHIGNITLQRITGDSGLMGTMIGDKRYWRSGHGTEAKSLLIQMAFIAMGLTRVWTSHHVDNYPSIRGNQKLGFKVTTRRGDVIYMALRKENFVPWIR